MGVTVLRDHTNVAGSIRTIELELRMPYSFFGDTSTETSYEAQPLAWGALEDLFSEAIQLVSHAFGVGQRFFLRVDGETEDMEPIVTYIRFDDMGEVTPDRILDALATRLSSHASMTGNFHLVFTVITPEIYVF